MTTHDELVPGLLVRFNNNTPNEKYRGMEVILREYADDTEEWTFEITKVSPGFANTSGFTVGSTRKDSLREGVSRYVDILGMARPPEFFSVEAAQKWLDERPVHANVDLEHHGAKP